MKRLLIALCVVVLCGCVSPNSARSRKVVTIEETIVINCHDYKRIKKVKQIQITELEDTIIPYDKDKRIIYKEPQKPVKIQIH